MQVTESEIVIPLKYKSHLRTALIKLCVSLVFLVGLFSFLIVLALQMIAKTSRFPDIQEQARQEVIFGVVALFLIFLLDGMLIISFIRRMRIPSPYIRINHEGIFTSYDTFLLRWEEIKEFAPYIYLGQPVLGAVLWNAETVLSRAKVSSKRSFRLAVGLNQRFARLAKLPSPYGIAQKALPISINELIVSIQRHFATELRQHHITIRDWQY